MHEAKSFVHQNLDITTAGGIYDLVANCSFNNHRRCCFVLVRNTALLFTPAPDKDRRAEGFGVQSPEKDRRAEGFGIPAPEFKARHFPKEYPQDPWNA